MKHIFREITHRKQRFLEMEVLETLFSKLIILQLRKYRTKERSDLAGTDHWTPKEEAQVGSGVLSRLNAKSTDLHLKNT